MRHPTAIDAMSRWLILSTVGVASLLVLPADMLGTHPLFTVAGHAFTASHAVGLVVVLVSWIAFAVRLARFGTLAMDAPSRALGWASIVALFVSVVASFVGLFWLLVVGIMLAAVAHAALAIRVDKVRAKAGVGRSRRGLAASGS